jgi:hypothetical protein
MVECRDCGECMEAYDWITHLLRHHLWKFSQLEETCRLIDEAGTRLAELRREEANAKARIRKIVNDTGEADGSYGESVIRNKQWRAEVKARRERRSLA